MAEFTKVVETGARDALNASLGLFQTVAEKVDQVQKGILSGYQNLVAKGAADNSEVVVKLRGGLDAGINGVKDFQARIESALKN